LGGYQGLSGVTPDLSTFGKALANGFPIAALAGKRALMDLAISDDPSRRVLIAGTYNCHPVAVAATYVTLKTLADAKADIYGRLEQLAQRLEEGQRRLFHDFRITATINRVRYRRALIERGIYYFPVPVKQGSISAAHTADDIDATLDATESALRHLTA
jgi:glutamate-1-semialdehyde 2,1-aminomutase